jgi:hypothetical protein
LTPTEWNLLSTSGASAISVAATSGSSVHISNISPPTDQHFTVGQKVSLEVQAAYTMASDSGAIAIAVQSADNQPITQNFEVVTRGSGTITLKAQFDVPDTKAIQVFVPLSAQGQSGTTTVDIRAYKVESP